MNRYIQFPLFILFLILGTSLPVVAQSTTIRSTTVEFEKQQVPALRASITPPRKDLQDAFEDWMDDTYDINMKGGGLFSDKEIRSAEDISLAPVSSDRINLFTKTIASKNETNMYLFAARGSQRFIGPDEATAFAGLEQIFDDFLSYYLPEYYAERVAEAKEELEDLQDDLKDLRDDIADNEEKIQQLRKENIDLESEAGELEKAIRDAEALLEKRRNTQQRVNRQLRGGGR